MSALVEEKLDERRRLQTDETAAGMLAQERQIGPKASAEAAQQSAAGNTAQKTSSAAAASAGKGMDTGAGGAGQEQEEGDNDLSDLNLSPEQIMEFLRGEIMRVETELAHLLPFSKGQENYLRSNFQTDQGIRVAQLLATLLAMKQQVMAGLHFPPAQREALAQNLKAFNALMTQVKGLSSPLSMSRQQQTATFPSVVLKPLLTIAMATLSPSALTHVVAVRLAAPAAKATTMVVPSSPSSSVAGAVVGRPSAAPAASPPAPVPLTVGGVLRAVAHSPQMPSVPVQAAMARTVSAPLPAVPANLAPVQVFSSATAPSSPVTAQVIETVVQQVMSPQPAARVAESIVQMAAPAVVAATVSPPVFASAVAPVMGTTPSVSVSFSAPVVQPVSVQRPVPVAEGIIVTAATTAAPVVQSAPSPSSLAPLAPIPLNPPVAVVESPSVSASAGYTPLESKGKTPDPIIRDVQSFMDKKTAAPQEMTATAPTPMAPTPMAPTPMAPTPMAPTYEPMKSKPVEFGKQPQDAITKIGGCGANCGGDCSKCAMAGISADTMNKMVTMLLTK